MRRNNNGAVIIEVIEIPVGDLQDLFEEAQEEESDIHFLVEEEDENCPPQASIIYNDKVVGYIRLHNGQPCIEDIYSLSVPESIAPQVIKELYAPAPYGLTTWQYLLVTWDAYNQNKPVYIM